MKVSSWTRGKFAEKIWHWKFKNFYNKIKISFSFSWTLTWVFYEVLRHFTADFSAFFKCKTVSASLKKLHNNLCALFPVASFEWWTFTREKRVSATMVLRTQRGEKSINAIQEVSGLWIFSPVVYFRVSIGFIMKISPDARGKKI